LCASSRRFGRDGITGSSSSPSCPHAESGRRALVHGERELDYRAFHEAVERFAAALLQVGVERGDRVAIFLPRGIEECWSIFGVSMASCVFVPSTHF
jgi:acyl-CoA synthetase (AMP-forming)/AMP-acid ligase II